jgi:hypothetical protein
MRSIPSSDGSSRRSSAVACFGDERGFASPPRLRDRRGAKRAMDAAHAGGDLGLPMFGSRKRLSKTHYMKQGFNLLFDRVLAAAAPTRSRALSTPYTCGST